MLQRVVSARTFKCRGVQYYGLHSKVTSHSSRLAELTTNKEVGLSTTVRPSPYCTENIKAQLTFNQNSGGQGECSSVVDLTS